MFGQKKMYCKQIYKIMQSPFRDIENANVLWKLPYLYGFRMEEKNALNNVVAYPRNVKIKRTAWDRSSSLVANNRIPQIFEVITKQPKDLVLQTLVSNKFITPSN